MWLDFVFLTIVIALVVLVAVLFGIPARYSLIMYIEEKRWRRRD